MTQNQPKPTPSNPAKTVSGQRTGAAPRTMQTPIPPQQTLQQQNQQFIPARKGAPTPTPPPTTAMQKTMATGKATPTPTPPQNTMQWRSQSPAYNRRTMSIAPQSKATPMPVPALKTGVPPKPGATPMQQARGSMPMQSPAPVAVQPTPTPVPPPDTKAYFDRQVAKSKDQKFHMTVNGQDLGLTPFHVWPQRTTGPNSTSMTVSMRSDDGRVYDIEFVTTGAQVTGVRIARINGESVR